MAYKVMNVQDLIRIMKADKGEKSLRSYAKELDLSPSYVSDVFNGKRSPSDSIANHYGFARQYVVVDAIAASRVVVHGLNAQTSAQEKTDEKSKKTKKRKK